MGVDDSTSLSGILLSAVATGHGAPKRASAANNNFPGLCSIE